MTMNRIIPGIIIVLWIALLQFSMAEVIKVGPAQPYASLQDITSLVDPGDTVLVDGDHTYSGGVEFDRSGTAGKPIVIKGIRINDKRPVLSGGVNTIHFSTWPYDQPGADHYILEGFEITGGSKRGIFHQASDLVVRDCVVHDCPEHGILGADEGSGSLTLEYVEVYNCGSGELRHQLYISTDQINRPGSVFRMQYCYIHDGNGGNNIKSRAERNEIYYNWIENAYYHELELIGPELGSPELKREDSDVVGNVIWDRNDYYLVRIGGDGTGETNGRYRFLNNTFISNSRAVFRLFDGLQSVEMHNNIFYREGSAAPLIMKSDDAVWTNGVALIAGQKNWLKTNSQNIPTQWTGSVFGDDPGFKSIDSDDLSPKETSPLINAGANSFTGPDTFTVPDPLSKPFYVPPAGKIVTDPVLLIRKADQTLDIGAYEAGGADKVLNDVPLPDHFNLFQNFPNPFNNQTQIDFHLNKPQRIELQIYNSVGQSVLRLLSGAANAGHFSLNWNASGLPSGIYYYQLSAEDHTAQKKCLIIK
jgi:hypothetical protein